MDPFLETDGNPLINNAQGLMMYIDENLESRDLKNVKFLCTDFLTKSVIENASRGLHLFSQLEMVLQNKLTTLSFIAECLYHIDRYDLLLKAFYLTEDAMRQKLMRHSLIPPYRTMLLNISENLTQAEFENAKFLITDCIPVSMRNDVNSFVELALALEKLNRLSQSNVILLLQLCKDINRHDLEEKIMKYVQEFKAPQSVLQRPNTQQVFREAPNVQSNFTHRDQHVRSDSNAPQSISSQHGLHVVQQTQDVIHSQVADVMPAQIQRQNVFTHNNSVHPGGGHAGVSQAAEPVDHRKTANQQPVTQQEEEGCYPGVKVMPQKQLDLECLPEYKMDSKPRGHCVIINNETFHKDPTDTSSKLMKNRPGSTIDMQRLEECFKKLNFTVSSHTDKSAEQMVQLMDEFARKSHENYDCFVCCVLSHGSNDSLYGSDGRTIKMEDLTYGFKSIRCQTLAGKPKLFFIQACMGREKQEGSDIHQDSASGQYDPARIPNGSVPNEADFLLGYATVPGYVSYRSQTQGSWYITTLSKVLNRFADKCDLMSMLVKVNEEVSKAVATVENGVYKQVPAPLVTLRKRLFFR